MTGFAVTRATSRDGRWDYTLYIRPNDVPFIHALDTVALRAVCIDLPSVNQADLGNATLNLGPGGSVLSIEAQGRPVARVDTATYAVTPVAERAPAAPPTRRPAARSDQSTGGGGGDSTPWAVLALLLVAAAAFAVAGFGARRRGQGPDHLSDRASANASLSDRAPSIRNVSGPRCHSSTLPASRTLSVRGLPSRPGRTRRVAPLRGTRRADRRPWCGPRACPRRSSSG